MTDEKNIPACPSQEDLSLLIEIQEGLRHFFELQDINYQAKLDHLPHVPGERIKSNYRKITQLLRSIETKIQQICSSMPLTDYLTFEKIINKARQFIHQLLTLQSTDLAEFYKISHWFLVFYWGIEYYIKKNELDQIASFRDNSVLFFNMPDSVFEFILQLKEGPQPVEILAEVDLELRLDKRIPLLLSRTPDQIMLSPLGLKFLEVHEVAQIFFYYLYDFEEEVLDIELD
ncbi:MAG: hypothetical protein ACTSQI_15290 [Candidatus Helarchaeota archaeon]